METRNWLGISTVLLIAIWPLAIAATFLGFVLIAGDPAAPHRSPTQIAYDIQLHQHYWGVKIGPIFLTAWLLVFLALWWHRMLRKQWKKEIAENANTNMAHPQ